MVIVAVLADCAVFAFVGQQVAELGAVLMGLAALVKAFKPKS